MIYLRCFHFMNICSKMNINYRFFYDHLLHVSNNLFKMLSFYEYLLQNEHQLSFFYEHLLHVSNNLFKRLSFKPWLFISRIFLMNIYCKLTLTINIFINICRKINTSIAHRIIILYE